MEGLVSFQVTARVPFHGVPSLMHRPTKSSICKLLPIAAMNLHAKESKLFVSCIRAQQVDILFQLCCFYCRIT